MYKTVRHGENSLQYTILPQTEEVLINSGIKGKGRDYSPSIHVRRSRRKSTVKYILLVIFGLIVALMLAAIPICVMNGALYARRSQLDHHEITLASAPHTPAGREIVKSRKKELKILPAIIPTTQPKLEGSPTSTYPTSTYPTTMKTITSVMRVNEKLTTWPWTIPALRSWKTSTVSTSIKPLPTQHHEGALSGTSSGSVPLLDNYMSVRPWEKDVIIRPTAAPEIIRIHNNFLYDTRPFVTTEKTTVKTFKDALITSKPSTKASKTTTESDNRSFKDLKDAILSVDDDDEFKESLEVDEVFSLPPLKPDGSRAAGDEVTVAKAGDAGWYGARWPFVDTSSYFQWTGYSSGDNLLLPLLVAALSSVALVLLLALAVRRRKRTHNTAAIGLTTDHQVDDNTNLLAENVEDPEE